MYMNLTAPFTSGVSLEKCSLASNQLSLLLIGKIKTEKCFLSCANLTADLNLMVLGAGGSVLFKFFKPTLSSHK